MGAADEVPVVSEDPWFVVADRTRIAAMHEVQAAASDEARLEATLLATNLYTEQISHLADSIVDDLREAQEQSPSDFGAARAWIENWNNEAGRDRWAT